MELLKKLTEAFGPSGYEADVSDIIADEIKKYTDDVRKDRLGNVIALKKGSGKGKLMITAHMDQIGVMVTNIDKNGFLRFTNVGGINPHIIEAQRVRFKSGTIGIIAYEEKKHLKDIKLSNMYIDIGASTKEEAAEKVEIGEFGVFCSEYVDLGKRISSGALDNRLGCYAVIEAAKLIKDNTADVYYVFTVQEETFSSGAGTSAFAIEPDGAIVVDVTDTGDTPECNDMAVKLGLGAAVKIMDRSMISHLSMKNYLIETAKKNNLAYQLEILEAGGTDGGEIHRTGSGVVTGAVSIPTRYIHTQQEVADKDDIKGVIELLKCAAEAYCK